MRFLLLLPVAGALALSACAQQVPKIAYGDPQPAHLIAPPPPPVRLVKLPEPLPLPDQLKKLPPAMAYRQPAQPANPVARVAAANAAARINPTRDGYINAMQVFPWSTGALYEIYASPLHVTDIALQPGERLISIAAGDTVQWKIGNTTSGSGPTTQVHVLVKPISADLPMNNIVIMTNRRAYHLEIHPTKQTYMAAVSWNYPQDDLLALKAQNTAATDYASTVAASDVDLADLHFRYRISGDHPPWRPVQVFDDGSKVYIQFPPGIAQGDMPPLFILGASGGKAEIVNYRVRGNTMIVDRLFAGAELRLGAGPQQIVRITRTDGSSG
ncbi:P-type conjugative transfer protein TrbG [Acidiphilium sp. AL]|uniref:P-type conjugative transfer protein TrbG n=1 Tax=Acidiphilium iwatense TaxID=768198 RepID=A0ABS9E0W6_9PROT|nr:MULTISPECIES: P-type conjugative transfer protein TrbG [Acidiphilium]MCF3948050.1 P-type conjugative transfer protein TrbG [Acidiphilium iwatense]MCU4161918.1 P-type conjugative transfer protein TrbG [Acidiphilium sp. AL]